MKNKDPLHVSRRRFLAQLGGLTVAGMLGPSLLTPRSAHAADAVAPGAATKEGILTGSHWGAIRATVVDGRFVAAKPFEQDKYPSKMIAGLPDHVHNAARIRYPMVRVDWMRKGHQSDTRSAAIIVLCASPGMKRWICSIRNWSGCKKPTGRARY